MVSGQSKLHCPGSGKGPGLTPVRTEDNTVKGDGYRVALRITSDAPAPMRASEKSAKLPTLTDSLEGRPGAEDRAERRLTTILAADVVDCAFNKADRK